MVRNSREKLFYRLIAGIDFEYRGTFDIAPGDWQTVLDRMRNFDRGLLNFKCPAYFHAIIEGIHEYGMELFIPMVCEEPLCREEWEQAWSVISFFVSALQSYGNQRVLNRSASISLVNGRAGTGS